MKLDEHEILDKADMTTTLSKVGLGGGCHWCTEGVFDSLTGVSKVNQGWIASFGQNADFSEAIEVFFDPSIISLLDLIEIHLYTHACTSDHAMRGKYRSAVYTYCESQFKTSVAILARLEKAFDAPLVTQVCQFRQFKMNKLAYINYYYSAPNRPFCQTYIAPKLKLLLNRFNQHIDHEKVAQINLKRDA